MKGFFVALLLLSGVSIDQPPRGLRQSKDAGSADAGEKLTAGGYRQELRKNLDVLLGLMTADAKKPVKIKTILYSQRNADTDHDAVFVTFAAAGEPDISMLFIRSGAVWRLFPSTFGEENGTP